MAEPENIPRLQITSPEELTQVIPYLIGFTPEESLVIVVIDQDRVAVTARVDLADIQRPGEAEHLLDRIWARFPDASGCLVAYTDDQQAAWPLLNRCRSHLPRGAARQAMVIDGDTWHLVNGLSGAADPYGRLAAEASYRGLQRLPSRSQLVASFASPSDSAELSTRVDTAISKLPAADDTDAVIARMGELVRRNLPTAGDGSKTLRVGAEDAVQLAVLAQHGSAREVALLSITRSSATEHLAMWRSVVNNVPEFGAEAPLFLAGMAAWAAGEGAAASIALERVDHLSQRGHYPPAKLLDELIDQVVPPTAWDDLRTSGLASADPRVRDAVSGAHTQTVWESVPQHSMQQRPHQPPDIAPPAPGIAI